jgi:O-antigen/teichoic acid export membrane protein
LSRVGTRALSSLAFGFILILLARGTEQESFGAMMVTYSIGMLVGLIAGFGAPFRVLRSDVDSATTPSALFLVHTVSVLTFGGVYLTWAAMTHRGWAAVAGIILATSDTLINYGVSQTTAQDRHALANAMLVIHRIIPFTGIVAMYFIHRSLDFFWVSVLLATPIVMAIAVPACCISPRVGLHGVGTVFRGSWGYWLFGLTNMQGQLQIPVLALVSPTVVVANFAIASKTLGPMAILTSSISMIVIPELARRLAEPAEFDRLFKKLRIAMLSYFVVVVSLAWPIGLVVLALVGAQYRDALPIVIGMVIGAGISGVSQAYNAKLLAMGRPHSATKAVLAGGTVALASIVILGSQGHEGELWLVPIVSELVVVIMMIAASRFADSTRATEPATPSEPL